MPSNLRLQTTLDSQSTQSFYPSPFKATVPERKSKMSLSQTYRVASSARTKLGREANRADHDLRLLVGHANLLDSLMVELADAEREQEAWFNETLKKSTKPEEPRRVQWIDTISEEEFEDDSDDSDSDSDFEEEDMQMSMPTRRSTSPPPSSYDLYYDEDEEVEDFDDDEDHALVRVASHPPPELIHEDSDSDDDSSPPSPPSTSLEFDPKQQVIGGSFFGKVPQQTQPQVLSQDFMSNTSQMVMAY